MLKRNMTVLVAEDDLQLLDVITLNLELESYGVLRASDGRQALDQFERYHPDLLLLDVIMPRVNGFTVCQRVRTHSTVPILIITARGQEQERIRGLDLGADEVIVKPFSVSELLARVRAMFRRVQFATGEQDPTMPTPMLLADLSIDFAQHLVRMAGRKIVLTPTEYRLLASLARNAGKVVPQERLLEHVWGSAYMGEHHLLQVNVNRLRHKLETDPAHPRYLLTEAGVGYLLTAPSGDQQRS